MAVISYNEIVSCFLPKVEEYDFLRMSVDDFNDFFTRWLHGAVSKPYVRKLFSSLTLDDEIMQLDYEMNYSIDDESDKDFILEVLALGAGIQWITPKINSSINIQQVYASKEEKYYSQAQHLSELRALKKDWVKEQRGMIRDRGYIWNTYLDGGI